MEEEKMLVPSGLKTVDGKDIMCYTGAFYLKNEEKIKRIIKKCEEILDAEGEDLDSAYTDSLPDSEPYPNDYAEPMRENRLTPEEIKKITLERKERWKKYKEEYEEFFGEEFELELADDRSTGKK